MENGKYELHCQGKCVWHFRLYKNYAQTIYWQYSNSDPCGQNSKLPVSTSRMSTENLPCTCFSHQKWFAIRRSIFWKDDLYPEILLVKIQINKKAVCTFRTAICLLYCLEWWQHDGVPSYCLAWDKQLDQQCIRRAESSLCFNCQFPSQCCLCFLQYMSEIWYWLWILYSTLVAYLCNSWKIKLYYLLKIVISLTHLLKEVTLYFSELPYGWEKIDDPIYGTYYVE